MKKILFISSLIFINHTAFAKPIQSPATQHPVRLSEKNIQWSIAPRLQIRPSDLDGQNRTAKLLIDADTQGKITNVTILESTGLPSLDQKLIRTVARAQFKPYIYKGLATPFQVIQPFDLSTTEHRVSQSTSEIQRTYCQFPIITEMMKERKPERSFNYKSKFSPILIEKEEFKNDSYTIQFEFKLSRDNQMSDLKFTQLSQLSTIDTRVVSEIMDAKIYAPRHFWQFYKLKFHDKIIFRQSDCN